MKRYDGNHATAVAGTILGIFGALIFGGVLAYGSARREVIHVPETHFGVFIEEPGLIASIFGKLTLGDAKPIVTVQKGPLDYLVTKKNKENTKAFLVPDKLKVDFRLRVVKGSLQRLADKWKNADLASDSMRRRFANLVSVKPLAFQGSAEFPVTKDALSRIISPQGDVKEFENVFLDRIEEASIENFETRELPDFELALKTNLQSVLKEEYGIQQLSLSLSEVEILEGEPAEQREAQFVSAVHPAPAGTSLKVFWKVFWKCLPWACLVVLVVIGMLVKCPELLEIIASLITIFS